MSDVDEIIYNIRLHPPEDATKVFHCDNCGCAEFRQVTDILQGSMGFEVYECRDCKSWYRCKTIETIPEIPS